MKRFIAAIAGLLAGLVLGWWLKPREEHIDCDKSISVPPKKVEKIKLELKRVKPCQEQEEAHTNLADRDENGKAIGGVIPKGWMYNLADTPITWKSEDGWVFDGTSYGMKILGIFDRELTNDELRRIHGVGADEIEKSFEDTQPIRISSQSEEK
jgi:hypothetical protein